MDKSRSISLRIGAGAHRGLVREDNQDRISRLLSPFGEVFVVADGMGGHEGGATAAQMLIDCLGVHLRALPPETPPDEALRQAAAQTNADIHRRAQGSDPHLARMGATSVVALIQGNRAWIGHAGDSRAYLWRDGRLARLTRDHTLVQRMLDHQILNDEEARHHPDANVVTRAFGQTPEIELEIAPPLELEDGDRLLLCSDGLSGSVDDAAIAEALAADSDPQAVAQALIDLALQAGGEDNVSVQLLVVHDEAAPAVTHQTIAPQPAAVRAPAPRRGIPGFLLVLPLVLVGILAGVLLLPWKEWLAPKPPATAAPEETMPEPATSEMTDLPEPTDPFAAPSSPEPGGAAVPEGPAPAGAQQPRVSVLRPGGAPLPEVKQRVLREYRGNWSTPEPLGAGLAGALEEGRVYFRAGFGPAAADLAHQLGYAPAAWPPTLAADHPDTDLLVVYSSKPAPSAVPGGAR
ncbi:MAG TPA: protein phosphatase 2C domain-containing protein [Thermoanaerobaculia bacterium]|nr:protein phosphatase 2C domain-containing protein [Thermoanaerobaculia bacterium]